MVGIFWWMRFGKIHEINIGSSTILKPNLPLVSSFTVLKKAWPEKKQ
jgi:hypothetical protein